MRITKDRFDLAKTDRNELERILEHFRERLRRFIASRLAKRERRLEIDEVLQETLVRSCSLFERVEWRGERALFGWLCGISLHVIQEMERRFLRISNELPSNDNCDDTTPSRALRRKERFQRLKTALERLSEDERLVIQLMRIDGVPLKEVSKRIERTERATYQLLWRSMKKLKTVFGDTMSLRLSDDRLEASTNLTEENDA